MFLGVGTQLITQDFLPFQFTYRSSEANGFGLNFLFLHRNPMYELTANVQRHRHLFRKHFFKLFLWESKKGKIISKSRWLNLESSRLGVQTSAGSSEIYDLNARGFYN
jgi:hypothetical protein